VGATLAVGHATSLRSDLATLELHGVVDLRLARDDYGVGIVLVVKGHDTDSAHLFTAEGRAGRLGRSPVRHVADHAQHLIDGRAVALDRKSVV